VGVDDRCGIDAVGRRRRGRTINGHTIEEKREDENGCYVT
jgi:hypothetical protein